MADTDKALFLWINSLVGSFELFDRAIEWVVSDYMIPASMTLVLVGLWFVGKDGFTRNKYQIGVLTALSSMALSSGAVFVINAVYFRPRPFENHEVSMLFYQPTDSSFPSNSAAATFAIAAAVWGVNRRVGSILFATATVYGFARIYAGVHYPLDIGASALIAVIVTSLVYKGKHLIEPLPTIVIKAARILCLA